MAVRADEHLAAAPAATDPAVGRPRRRRGFRRLAFSLGFAQGCGLCFFVASGSFFSERFGNPRFFVDACAFFYIPPILITFAQLLLDHRFDALLGIRVVIRFRIILSSIVTAALLAVLGEIAAAAPGSHQQATVFGLGSALGCFAAVLLGSSSLLFGAVDPRFVPLLILGQTAAGVFASLAARVVGFAPGCSAAQARAFFDLGAGVVLVVAASYGISNHCDVLESAYQRHEELMTMSLAQSQSSAEAQRSSVDPAVPSGADGGGAAAPAGAGPPARSASVLGMPPLCWSMALCQALAIAMNMSLTPLSNQIAHKRYNLSQEVVLTKLLGDFVGRSAFLFLPKPRADGDQDGSGCGRPRRQAMLVWLVELCRLPLWVMVFLWALGSSAPAFLANDTVLLWAVWLPLIASGAFSASWCLVIAVSSAQGEAKRASPLMMSCSVYIGFSTGILVALLSP